MQFDVQINAFGIAVIIVLIVAKLLVLLIVFSLKKVTSRDGRRKFLNKLVNTIISTNVMLLLYTDSQVGLPIYHTQELLCIY